MLIPIILKDKNKCWDDKSWEGCPLYDPAIRGCSLGYEMENDGEYDNTTRPEECIIDNGK